MLVFSQSTDEDSPKTASLPVDLQSVPARRRNVSVARSTWLLKNKPAAADGLTIDGNLECAMAHHQGHLTISKDARVEANIHAGTVVIFGQLVGNIFSEGKVSLTRGSEVQGDICCSRLDVEDGARFRGRVVMKECPASADLEYF